MIEEKPEYFLVMHVHEFESGEEDLKIIGLFRSPERAEQAVASAKLLSGFRDTPDGFEIVPYELDRAGWLEGYETVMENDEQE
ncbi:DUF7336 domain-containing protein [Streptacidiphilus cavernicola]|uniref:DUF7336 domain-containing protein n=1 Tax=Streptacidiphilus cavernicola TaxID=3342716 RepID=A0ABV6VNU5_9ACTN